MNHRHRIFHRDGLAARLLHIQLCSPKAGEQPGLFRRQEMRAVKLGADMDAQIEAAHRREGARVIGHGDGKIPAETDHRPGAAVDHRFGGLHRVVAVRRRRRKAKHLVNFAEKRRRRFFGDPNGAVSLNVRMAAQGANPRAGFANIAAHQQQVGNQTHVGGAFVVLGDAHAIGDDGGVGFGIGLCDLVEVLARQARFALNRRPACRLDIRRKIIEALGVRGDKIGIQRVFKRQQMFCDAFQRGSITARFHLEIGRGDIGGAVSRHLHHALRIGKPLQCALTHRVEHDNRHLAAGQLVQRPHHSRVVSAGVMAD
ncbi:hypothetical protein D3C72_579060 [compost metagenome]